MIENILFFISLYGCSMSDDDIIKGTDMIIKGTNKLTTTTINVSKKLSSLK